MTDQLPSKERIDFLAEYWAAKAKSHERRPEGQGLQAELIGLIYADTIAALKRINSLTRKLDTCGLECSATLKSLVAENERLRTCLTGISTCSTCEACRGAARLALGGETSLEAEIGALLHPDWCPSCTKPYAECRCNGVAR